MTVRQRTPPEYDIIVGKHDAMQRQLLFPWQAIHEGESACNFRGVFYTEAEAAHALATHTCHQKYEGVNGLSIAEQYWLELDSVIDQIKANTFTTPEPLVRMQGRASGLAFAITKACQPYYADENAVSKEALRRWKMRNGQLDWEATPGFRYNPPIPGANPTQNIGETATYTQPHNSESAPTSGRRRTKAAVTAKQLTPMEEETIRKTGGAFPTADLAKMYGVPEATIKAILNTP